MTVEISRRFALQVVTPLLIGFLPFFRATAALLPRQVSPEVFGAHGKGDDDQLGLERALDYCKHHRTQLVLGPKCYLHSGDLVLDGVDLSGDAQLSEIQSVSDTNSSIILTGSGSRLSNIVKSSANAKIRKAGLDGIKVINANNFVIEDCSIRHTAATGIFISHSEHGTVKNITIQETLADGLHITGCSSNIYIESVKAIRTGDDGIAVVSYHKDGGICHDITIALCISTKSKARGIAVVGGADVHIKDSTVEASRCAGLYLFGEAAYDTYGVTDCSIDKGVVTDCVTDKTLGHACVMLGGRNGADLVNGQLMTRGADKCVVTGLRVQRPGSGSYSGISFRENSTHCNVTRCTVAKHTIDNSLGYLPFSDKGICNVLRLNTLI